MTECERLIANGTFSPDFFKPEMRCDFLVTEERKKAWAIEIDLVLQVERVCKKYGLRFFLAEGSLLGAIRHNGYIPWDDDMDIIMLRSDFDELLKHADAFGEPYFLQTPHTDPKHGYAIAQLRNSNTTFAVQEFLYQGMNLGICVDILVLDNADLSSYRARFEQIKKLILLNSTFMRLTNKHLLPKDVERVRNYPGGDSVERFDEIHRLAQLDNNKPTEYLFPYLSAGNYGCDRCLWPAAAYKDSILWPFEGFMFPVPVGYETILSTEYGEYRQFPPIKDRGCWHSTTILHPDIPYSEYVSHLV